MFQTGHSVRYCPGFPLRFAWAPSLPPPAKSPGTNLRRNPGQYRTTRALPGNHSDSFLSTHSRSQTDSRRVSGNVPSGTDLRSSPCRYGVTLSHRLWNRHIESQEHALKEV